MRCFTEIQYHKQEFNLDDEPGLQVQGRVGWQSVRPVARGEYSTVS